MSVCKRCGGKTSADFFCTTCHEELDTTHKTCRAEEGQVFEVDEEFGSTPLKCHCGNDMFIAFHDSYCSYCQNLIDKDD